MGQVESTDSRLMQDSSNHFALTFKPTNRLQIVNAGKDVIRIFEEVLHHSQMISSTNFKGSTSTYEIRINGIPFCIGVGSILEFKLAFMTILDKLYQELSLYPFVSSDLCLYRDTSTVFFRKNDVGQPKGNYACIAPSWNTSLDIINVPLHIHKPIIYVLQQFWGISSEIQQKRNNYFRIDLRGYPWGGFGASGEYATPIRRLLLKLIETMRHHSYTFVVNISMKSTCDMLYFQYDPNLPPDTSQTFMMYLSKWDRLRFIDAPQHVTNGIKTTIGQVWQGGITDERLHNDALEFKLKGRPWNAYFHDAVPSRYLISNILAEARRAGFKCIGTLDISRRSDDKSIFIFKSTSEISSIPPTVPVQWTCFYFCGWNKLILVGDDQGVASLLNEYLGPIVKGGPTRESNNVSIWKFCSSVFSYGNDSPREFLYTALIRIHERMKSLGWELVSSADVSSRRVKRNDKWESYDAHSWYFLNTGRQLATGPWKFAQ